MSWLLKLPESLRVAAYYAGEEVAWPAESAINVIECATNLGVAVCGVEVWLPTVPGPTIPTPYVYVWETDERKPEEDWRNFVRRANSGAAVYIRGFAWAAGDKAHKGLEPYFNLDMVDAIAER
jgi:hypothetical protein